MADKELIRGLESRHIQMIALKMKRNFTRRYRLGKALFKLLYSMM
ncbi:hypothetical protein V7266_11945 [Neobacillus drentensis]